MPDSEPSIYIFRWLLVTRSEVKLILLRGFFYLN